MGSVRPAGLHGASHVPLSCRGRLTPSGIHRPGPTRGTWIVKVRDVKQEGSRFEDLTATGAHGLSSVSRWRLPAVVEKLACSSDVEARRSIALDLPLVVKGRPRRALVTSVIRLTHDPDARVRDYACMALGSQWRELRDPRISDALAERLHDPDGDVRAEAMLGLAFRHDARTFAPLCDALTRADGSVGLLEIRAAGALGDVRLFPLVAQHRDGWDPPDEVVVEAALELVRPDGPREALIDEVVRFFDGNDDDASRHAWNVTLAMLGMSSRSLLSMYSEVRGRVQPDVRRRLRHSGFGQQVRRS